MKLTLAPYNRLLYAQRVLIIAIFHFVLVIMHKATSCCQNFDYFVADKQYILFVECA